MGSQLDIIGSVILAGLLLMGIAQFNSDKQAAMLTVANKTTLQSQMESVTSTMLFDLRKAGLRVTSGNTFLTCNRNAVSFRGDIDNNGSVDTISYSYGTAVDYTPNERDSLLTRRWNNIATEGTDAGITNLRFRYYDSTDVETALAAKVRTVRVVITCQARSAVWNGAMDEMQTLSSDFRVTPRNLKR